MDYQQVVDEIRSFLQSNDQTLTNPLPGLASEYADACRAANQRLRRCEEFLKRGLRSEAIQFADAEPVLLDLVAALDFPERARWEEVSLTYGFPASPRLQIETAQALNRAYTEEQPLARLLRDHRRLALARAPLSARLTVLRKIALLDKQNAFWMEDVAEWEKTRCRQIQAEAKQAVARNQVVAVAALARELEETAWITPPLPPLVAEVKGHAKRYALKEARTELEQISGRLRQAHTDGDLVSGQAIRDRWQELLPKAELSQDDLLLRLTEAPLRWVIAQERRQGAELDYQTDVANLEAALDAQADAEELTRLYHTAMRHPRGVPRPIQERYRDRLRRTDSSRRWRESIILLAVIFGGLALVLGLLGYLVLQSQRQAMSQNTSSSSSGESQPCRANASTSESAVSSRARSTLSNSRPAGTEAS